ncbi:hypothetical protein [Methylosinus sp. PW1]|uniref:hypothetical protein n=1 Tax=Methylosinus sp. PW1 TaxID=107636 RepID=UPI00055E9A01|nr:hypothetical protein [Methylosinus sp. PW1]
MKKPEILTREQAVALFTDFADRMGRSKFAKAIGVTPGMITQVCDGAVPLSEKLAHAVGLEIAYIRSAAPVVDPGDLPPADPTKRRLGRPKTKRD